MRASVILVLVCLFLSACGGEWQRYDHRAGIVGGAVPHTYLRVGDHVDIKVFGEAEMSGQYKVDAQGCVILLLIGAVKVIDITPDVIARTIEEKLTDGGYMVDPEVVVTPQIMRHFYVLGEVLKAGEYPYKKDMSVLDAIAMAGGFTYRAQQMEFDLIRKNKDGTEMQLGATLGTKLHPDDLIRVRERLF